MALDRGTLAKIDRRVFAELDHTIATQAVKVPLSDAVWSTWRRYCEAIGLSMGEGVAGLIAHELEGVVDDGGAVREAFADQAERLAEERDLQLDAQERDLDARAERLRRKEEHVEAWEKRIRGQRAIGQPVQPRPKVGRNESCPCGSGFKYKHCHGLPAKR